MKKIILTGVLTTAMLLSVTNPKISSFAMMNKSPIADINNATYETNNNLTSGTELIIMTDTVSADDVVNADDGYSSEVLVDKQIIETDYVIADNSQSDYVIADNNQSDYVITNSNETELVVSDSMGPDTVFENQTETVLVNNEQSELVVNDSQTELVLSEDSQDKFVVYDNQYSEKVLINSQDKLANDSLVLSENVVNENLENSVLVSDDISSDVLVNDTISNDVLVNNIINANLVNESVNANLVNESVNANNYLSNEEYANLTGGNINEDYLTANNNSSDTSPKIYNNAKKINNNNQSVNDTTKTHSDNSDINNEPRVIKRRLANRNINRDTNSESRFVDNNGNVYDTNTNLVVDNQNKTPVNYNANNSLISDNVSLTNSSVITDNGITTDNSVMTDNDLVNKNLLYVPELKMGVNGEIDDSAFNTFGPEVYDINNLNKKDITKNFSEMYKKNKVVVMGSADIKVAPDVATLHITIDTINKDILEAEKENSAQVSKVVDTLVKYGIMKDDIKTKHYNTYENYDYKDGKTFIGHQISNYIEFSTRNTEQVSNLISQLMSIGVTQFHSINFSLSDNKTEYNNALVLALEDARTKAEALVGQNVELRVKKITECDRYGYYPESVLRSDFASEINNGSILSSDIRVTGKVLVEFIY